MNRKYSISEYINLVNYIRTKNKLFSISTDVIVGYPTETETDFKESFSNINKLKFADMHIFPYSIRNNTVAARLKNIVSDKQKRDRFDKIDTMNDKNKKMYLKNFINKIVNVIFEKPKDANIQQGHSEYYFMVYVNTKQNLYRKKIKIKIIKLIGDKLFGVAI
jgi:threonylcarbamoyladenosine tRNA methylthiotransferase MtaB